MSTIPELTKQGFTRFRKPFWNPGAYLEAFFSPDGSHGPWVTLVDPASEAALAAIGASSVSRHIPWQEAGPEETDWIGVPTATGPDLGRA